MKLNLNSLYTDIKRKKRSYDIFSFLYGNAELQVLFDTGTRPFQLYIIKKNSTACIRLSVAKGFILQTFLSQNDYTALTDMLGLPVQTKGFSTKKFFTFLDQQIPDHCQNEPISKQHLAQICRCEEPDRVYLKGFTNWDEQPSKKHVSHLNREKTRILYPDLYRKIHDKNISVIYSEVETPFHYKNFIL